METQNPPRAAIDDVSLQADSNNAESSAALDALFQDHTGRKPPEPTEAEKAAAAKKAEDDAKAAEAARAAEPTDLDDAAARVAADNDAAKKAADDAKAAAKKAEDDAKAAEAGKTTPEPVKDAFDDVQLPEGVKPKSAESFQRVKELAKQTANDLRTKVAEAEKARAEVERQLAETRQQLEAAAKAPLSKEAEAELADLRGFRLSKEVESDPRLKAFDTTISRNVEGIYKKLADAGLGEAALAQIKELGGPDKVDWDPIFPKLPVATRRYIEATLVENERQLELRAEALETAKAEGQKYIETRTAREVAEMTETANTFLKDLPWTKEREVPATATPEQRAAIEADNTFAKESVSKLKAFLSDRSPAHVAELAVGTLIAYRNKAQLEAVQAKLKSVEESHAAALKDVSDKLAKALEEKTALERDLLDFRKAELPRGAGGGNVVTPPPKKGIEDTRHGGDALDAYAAEVAAAARD